MNKEEQISHLKRAIEIQKSRLPKLQGMDKKSENIFGPVDPFGNSWKNNLNITVKATLAQIKNLEENLAKLEAK